MNSCHYLHDWLDGRCNTCSAVDSIKRISALESQISQLKGQQSPEAATIETSKDSKLYMQGFEDGQAMGRISAELQAKAERAALAAHWEDGNANS